MNKLLGDTVCLWRTPVTSDRASASYVVLLTRIWLMQLHTNMLNTTRTLSLHYQYINTLGVDVFTLIPLQPEIGLHSKIFLCLSPHYMLLLSESGCDKSTNLEFQSIPVYYDRHLGASTHVVTSHTFG